MERCCEVIQIQSRCSLVWTGSRCVSLWEICSLDLTGIWEVGAGGSTEGQCLRWWQSQKRHCQWAAPSVSHPARSIMLMKYMALPEACLFWWLSRYKYEAEKCWEIFCFGREYCCLVDLKANLWHQVKGSCFCCFTIRRLIYWWMAEVKEWKILICFSSQKNWLAIEVVISLLLWLGPCLSQECDDTSNHCGCFDAVEIPSIKTGLCYFSDSLSFWDVLRMCHGASSVVLQKSPLQSLSHTICTSDGWSNLPKATQAIWGRAGIQTCLLTPFGSFFLLLAEPAVTEM